MREGDMSTGLARFLARLTTKERDRLAEQLRQPRTYVAEDMVDLLAILKSLED